MTRGVDLIWLNGRDTEFPAWSLGRVWRAQTTPQRVHEICRSLQDESGSDFLLFWDARLGMPDEIRIREVADRPGDLWHAGLRLGMGGKPGLMDFIHPTWMLNRDPDPRIEATSWRMSLSACIIPREVLAKLGVPYPVFQTLEGAALEMGHRYIKSGVLMRYVPDLVPNSPNSQVVLPFEDELRFVWYRFGRKWTWWALLRAVMTGYVSPWTAWHAWRKVSRGPQPVEPLPYRGKNRVPLDNGRERPKVNVSVLIPTVDRYPYLRTLLGQLRQQTVQPQEIIVVDQTSPERREDLRTAFPDLPLRVFYLDEPGQCSSRNLGLKAAEGEYVLFLDDDVEVDAHLIEKHLGTLNRFGAEVSSGVADEVGAGPLPEAFRRIRASDVFPTNNTLIRKDVFLRSGLFDSAYERGQRADGDLGMRVYLSGALMVLNPAISVFHHHAPRGGLRTHKARAITYASSRKYITHRHLPSVTEIYLAKRYFTPRQVREALWLRVLGTFSLRGSWWKRMLKVGYSTIMLPHTLWDIRRRVKRAENLLREGYPKIEYLP